MNSIFHLQEPDDDPLSEEEFNALWRDAAEELRLSRNRALCALAATLLVCASVVPFSAGHVLHRLWVPVGQAAVWLSLGLLIVSLYCCVSWWSAWRGLRYLDRDLDRSD